MVHKLTINTLYQLHEHLSDGESISNVFYVTKVSNYLVRGYIVGSNSQLEVIKGIYQQYRKERKMGKIPIIDMNHRTFFIFLDGTMEDQQHNQITLNKLN